MGGRGKDSQGFHLDEGSQGKHIPGHNNWDESKGRSPITISIERLKELFDKYHGTGTIEYRGNAVREIVNFNEVIGKVKNPYTREMEFTTWGKIHYDSTGGWHIVPLFVPEN